ncbi:MAG TPA: hypothetical protein VGG28_17035 [Kofleriaceae bacterium]|jgi:hypothetical protein
MFIVRSQGFFYTDEYYSPTTMFRAVIADEFKTRKAATEACAKLVRTWVRSEPLGNYLFDDHEPIDKVVEYIRDQWPDDDIEWDSDLSIPDDASDAQVDEIVKRMGVVFAQVFEVDGDAGEDEIETDDLHFGPDEID